MYIMLQSIFFIQLMFALLNAALCDPLQMEVMCDVADFSPWHRNKVDLLQCPDPSVALAPRAVTVRPTLRQC